MSNTSYHSKENNQVMIQGGEKKVMKKILSVALSTAMAFSMFASVAFGDSDAKLTTQQKFDILKEAKIVNGYPDGSAGLEKDMNRAEFAKVVANLMGLEPIKGQLSFKDKGYTEKYWATPYIEAVYAAGLMEGKNTTKKIFDYKGKVTVQEMAAVLVRALKLEVPENTNNNASNWAKGYVQAAIDAKILDANANPKANATRAQLTDTAYEIYVSQQKPKVVSNEVKENGKVVEFKLANDTVVKVELETALVPNKETEVKFSNGGYDYTEKVTWVITTATKVESVSATNLKEINVVFDGTVDKATAEDKDRYSVDSSVTIESASLMEDGKTVRLTVNNSLINQKNYTVSVRNVKAGDKTVSASKFAFTPLDNALPEVVSVKSLGTKAVKVTFSEPVKTASSSNFKLDGKTFFGSVSEGKRDVILKPYSSSDLTVGAHKLEISGVEDYNQFKALSKTVDFEVVLDEVAPTISSVSATLEKATVTFSEEVDPDTISKGNVYWKSGNDKKSADSVTQVSPNVYEFSFKSNPFPGYETSLFVEGVKDYSGNQITATEAKVRAEVDQTRPEVTEVSLKSTNNKVIVVKFSKEVKIEDVRYFTLTNSKGEVVPLRTVKATDGTNSNEGKVFELEAYNALDASYNLKISGVRDTTKLNNTMLDYTTSVVGKDTTAPTYTSNSGNSRTRTLYINFSEKMDPATIGDKSNYLVEINGKMQQLPSGTDVTPVNEGKSVRIIFPQYIDNDAVGIVSPESAANITKFKYLALKDLAGNVVEGIGGEPTAINVANAKVAKYENNVDYNAKLTAEGVIKVRFDQPISKADRNDFEVTQGAVTNVVTDGTEVVTVHVSGLGKTGLTSQNSIDDLDLSIKAGNKIQSITGNPTDGGSVEVHDGMSPVVQLPSNETRLQVSGSNTILLPFSETLKTGTVEQEAQYRYDLVVTNIRTGHPLNFNQYTTSVDNNVLKISLVGADSADDFKVKVKKDAAFIQDRAGNKAAETTIEYSSAAGGINTVVTGVAGTANQTAAGVPSVTGVKEVNKVTVAVDAAAQAGKINVKVDDSVTPITKEVDVNAGDVESVIAAKIAAAFTGVAGYTVKSDGNDVIFTVADAAADKNINISIEDLDAVAAPTKVTGTDVEVTPGVAEVVGTPEVNTFTVGTAPTKAGLATVTFTDGTVNKNATFNVTTTTTTAQVAAAIVSALSPVLADDYNVTVVDSVVTFTAKAPAADKDVRISLK